MKALLIFLLALIIFNFLTFTNYYSITAIYCFTFLLTVPGFIFLKIFNYKKSSNTYFLLLIVGLSLSFLLFFGLSINYLLPLFGINNPLSKLPVVSSFDILYIFATVIFFIQNRKLEIPSNILKPSNFIYLVPCIFPILSIFGAISLNNGSTNAITLSMLGIIGVYLIFLILFRKKTHKLFPISIYMIALSVLLMLSLRSWYISGSGNDISLEYQVFQITKLHNLWNINNFRSAYNACLSITIIPTIFSNVLNINDQYIYKLLFKFIFSFVPVCIYFLIKEKTSSIIAFFSALFYISQPWFIDPMVYINRQEIAFLFFGLILIVLLDSNLKHKLKSFFFIIFSFSIVLSHYSTTYITVILFISIYLISKILELKFINQSKIYKKIIIFANLGQNTEEPNNKFISGRYLLIFITFAFLWYSQLTPTSNNVFVVIRNTFNNLQNFANEDSRSGIVYQLFNSTSNVNQNTYNNYVKNTTNTYANNENSSLYPESTYKDFVLTPKASRLNFPTNDLLYNIISKYYQLLIFFTQLSCLIGTLYLIFIKNDYKINYQYVYLMLIAESLLLAMVILPYASQAYNFDRLYLQVMIFIAVTVPLGTYFIFKFFNENIQINITNIILISIFLFTFGFIWQFVGGKTDVWLNNYGSYYDYDYTHKSEVASVNWLAQRAPHSQIVTDINGRNLLWTFGNLTDIVSNVIPQSIATYSYVYLTYSNVKEDIAYFSYNGAYWGYSYPKEFLNNNKNLIYNNGSSEIYK